MLSYLGYTSSDTSAYTAQYANAFECLFNERQHLIDKGKVIDLPLLFLLRHYLENSLKYNIEYFRKVSGFNDNINLGNEHKLMDLFIAFDKHMDSMIKKYTPDSTIIGQISNYKSILEKLIIEISILDEKSFSFRYSHSSKNTTKNIEKNLTINLSEMGKLYKESKDLLNYSKNVFMSP